MGNAVGGCAETQPAAVLQAVGPPKLGCTTARDSATVQKSCGVNCAVQRAAALAYAPVLASKSCRRCWRMLVVRSPRVRSSTPRNTSVLRRSPPVIASG